MLSYFFRPLSFVAALLVSAGLLWASSAAAQLIPDLQPSSEPEVPVLPNLNALNAGWWGYFEAEPVVTQKRIDEFRKSLQVESEKLNPRSREQAAQLIGQIDSNFSAYQELRKAKISQAQSLPAAAASYSLDELFSLVAAVRVADRVAAADEVDVDRARELLQAATRRRDQTFKNYIEAAPGDARWLVGLNLVRDRSTVAVTQGRLDLFLADYQRTLKYADEYQAQLSVAQQRLVVDGDNAAVNVASSAVAMAQTQVEKAAKNLQSAEMASTGLNLNLPLGKLQESLQRQELTVARITLTQKKLNLAMAEVRLWLTLLASESGDSLDQLPDQQLEWGAIVDNTRKNAAKWKEATESELLLVQSTSTADMNRELRNLYSKRLEVAKKGLGRLTELEDSTLDLSFGLDLVSDTASRNAGRFNAWFATFSLDAVGYWKGFLDLTETTLFSIGDTPITGWGILRVVLILVIAILVSRGVRHALERISEGDYTGSKASLYTFGRLFHYVLIIVAVLIALSSIGLDFSNLAIVAGALGVGIGFGLQSIVSNFVSGLIILFEQTLRVGDYIELDTGLTGSVKEINVRSTLITTNDNIDIVVPNSEFITTKLTNWTLSETILRVRVPFGVAYGTDKDLVKKAALEAADAVPYTLKNMRDREPDVWLVEFGDSSLNFILLVWVNRQGARRPTRTRASYLWQLDTTLKKYGIEIPFPQRDLHIRSGYRDAPPTPAPPATDPADQ